MMSTDRFFFKFLLTAGLTSSPGFVGGYTILLYFSHSFLLVDVKWRLRCEDKRQGAKDKTGTCLIGCTLSLKKK